MKRRNKRFEHFLQHDEDSCGAAALCTALSADYDPDYGSILVDLKINKVLFPNGTLPHHMVQSAVQFYRKLVSLHDETVGDHGVVLDLEGDHWVAFYHEDNDRCQVWDPQGRVYYLGRAQFRRRFDWGFALRDKGRGSFGKGLSDTLDMAAMLKGLRRYLA